MLDEKTKAKIKAADLIFADDGATMIYGSALCKRILANHEPVRDAVKLTIFAPATDELIAEVVRLKGPDLCPIEQGQHKHEAGL